MKHCFISIAVLLTVFFARPLSAQNTFQPFGVDAELLEAPICNHTMGTCPIIDYAAQAGAQWIRFFAVWTLLEPQRNTYQWGELPWQIWYAQQKGMKVYITMTWPPQWANGAVSNNPPYGNACGDCGRTVLNSNDTYNFFFNLVSQFNGSDTSGCPSSNAASCKPLVSYYGVLNEPDQLNNFNDKYYHPNNLGNYLNDYVTQYLSPAHSAIKAANPSAYVVAPELATGTADCGGFGGCSWNNSWMKPLNLYFNGLYDIVSIHCYFSDGSNGHNDAKNEVDQVWNNYDYGKPIWVTEAAYGNTSTNVTNSYIDLYNRSSYWKVQFYWLEGGNPPCSSADTLLCSNGSGNLVPTPGYFAAYQSVYGPH